MGYSEIQISMACNGNANAAIGACIAASHYPGAGLGPCGAWQGNLLELNQLL